MFIYISLSLEGLMCIKSLYKVICVKVASLYNNKSLEGLNCKRAKTMS